MNGDLEAVRATIARICGAWTEQDGDPQTGRAWAPQVFDSLARAGFVLLGVAEEHGGSGGGWEEAAVVVREIARWCVPLPVSETALLAGWLLSEAGLPVPQAPLTAAVATGVESRRVSGGQVLSGDLARVPFGHVAERLVLLVGGTAPRVCSLAGANLSWTRGTNLAGEPRDDLVLNEVFVPDSDTVQVEAHVDARTFVLRGALARSLSLVGAMEAAVHSSVAHSRERVQFGRPIIGFQAVQHHLAAMAAELAATEAAVAAAVHASDVAGTPDPILVAAAKAQAGRSATVVARLAHQTHGAMGFTEEHALHRSTTRLWSWRDEFGDERHWARVVGVAALGSEDVWQLLTPPTRRADRG